MVSHACLLEENMNQVRHMKGLMAAPKWQKCETEKTERRVQKVGKGEGFGKRLNRLSLSRTRIGNMVWHPLQ